MKSFVTRLLGLLAALTLGTAAVPTAAFGQKALVYCPVGTDVTGCDNTVAALTGDFPGGVDRLYRTAPPGRSTPRTANLWD
jgi:hypothetical protein